VAGTGWPVSQRFIAKAARPPIGRLSRLIMMVLTIPAAWAPWRNLPTATSAYITSATGTSCQ
jgi:hypothetical protein